MGHGNKSLLLVLAFLALVPHLLFLFQPAFIDERPIVSAHIDFVDQGTLIPGFAQYPSFSLYLTFLGPLVGIVVQHLWWGTGSLTDTTVWLLATQAVGLMFGGRVIVLACLCGAALLTWRAMGPGGPLAAVLVLATPGFLQYGSYLLPDVPLFLLAMIVMLSAMRAVEQGSARWLYIAAATAGLAASTKYNGASLVLVVATAGVLLHGRDLLALLRSAGICAVICLLAFLIGSPGWIFATDVFWGALQFELAHSREGHLGTHGVPGFGQMELLLRNFPVLTIGGIIGAVFGSRAADPKTVLAVVTLLSGFAIASMTEKQSLHYLFVAMPALVYFTAKAVDWSGAKARPGWFAAVGAVLVISTVMALPMMRTSSTDLAREWLDRNVTKDQTILRASAYVPDLRSATEFAEMAEQSEFTQAAAVLARAQPTLNVAKYEYATGLAGLAQADFLVTSAQVFDRYFEHGVFTSLPPGPEDALYTEFNRRRAFYTALFQSKDWQIVFEADTGHGPRTLVFGRPQAGK